MSNLTNLSLFQPRAVVVGEGCLFDDAITQLVIERTDLLVSHTIFSDEAAFLHVIKRDQPKIIVMCESGALDSKRVIHSISIDPLVIGLCILVIRISNTVMDIYEGPTLNAEKVAYRPRSNIVTTADELISILRENAR
jgi:hypothetical protein